MRLEEAPTPISGVVTADAGIVGRVEVADLEQGITGWVFDARDRGASLDVELLAGDLLLAVASTDRYRADLGSEDDPQFNPGFVFSSVALRAAALNPAADPDSRLSVRADGRIRLEGIQLPTIRALRDDVEEAGLPDRDTYALDLRRALATLADDAALLRRRPIRLISANLRGFIEQVSPIDRDMIAFRGWCHRDIETEQGAVLLDGEKHAAAFSIVTHERADLPDYAHAFVGVLHTAWRPRSRGSEPFLFFGTKGEFHFRSASAIKAVPIAELEGAIGHIPASGGQARLMDLRQLLLTNEGWVPRSDRLAGLGLALALDRVLLLPGFGALVEGWVLSGVRRLGGLALKLGGKVLHLDPRSLRRTPRDDLAKGYPTLRDSVPTAGFIGFFVGPLEQTDLLEPMLKAQFTDGVSVTIEVNPALLRQFDAAYDVDVLQRSFPSLAMEPMFDALVAARSALIKKRLLALAQPVLRAKAEHVMLQALPRSVNDLNLVLGGMIRNLGKLPPGVALALICDFQQSRELILRGIAAAQTRHPGSAVSLTLVESVDHALFSVPAVLQFHKAKRFVYAGADVCVTTEGWSQIAALLSADQEMAEDRATSLPVSTRVGGSEVRRPDDELFGWVRDAFTTWLGGAAAPFDEAAQRRGLPRGVLAGGAAPAAMRLRPAGRSAYKARLDERLFAGGEIGS